MRRSSSINLALAILLVSASGAMAAGAVFDKPLETKAVTLPPTETNPKPKLTCRYYPHFMVKEIDEGEVGAAQLSILPAVPKPLCQRQNIATEKVVDPKDWSGYVEGAKGDFVFFTADDGVNGALGFAVYAPSGKKLFEDAAVGDLHSLTVSGSTLTARYVRSFAGTCSVLKEGDSCWTKIAAAAHLDPAAKPDCKGGYQEAEQELAAARCKEDGKTGNAACIAAAVKEIKAQKWDEAPSVMEYEAETVLTESAATTKATGAVKACHPSD